MYGSLFLALVGIGIFGCKKEISSNQQKSNSQNVKEKSILYRVENGMLVLNTVDDFDQLIELSTEDFNQTLKDLDYMSYIETLNVNEVNIIEDGFLSVVLNKNLVVQIQNYIYLVNKASSKVFALHKDNFSSYPDLIAENISNKYVLEFSTEDNVFELLGEIENTEKSMSKNCRSTNSNSDGWSEYADFIDEDNIYSNGPDKRYKFERKFIVKYDNWGIYRKLYTEFKHNEKWYGLNDGTYFTIVYQVKYYVKNGNSGTDSKYPSYPFETTNPDSVQIPISNYDYFSDKKEIQHYKGTKCLKAYDLRSWCWMRNRKTLRHKLVPNNGCLRIHDNLCIYLCSGESC